MTDFFRRKTALAEYLSYASTPIADVAIIALRYPKAGQCGSDSFVHAQIT